MARAGVCLAVLLAGCGLVSKDFDVEQKFVAGGFPSESANLSASTLTGPLSADVSKISSITLKAARIEKDDGGGDISFISDATISVTPVHGSEVLLARLPAPPAAGQSSVQLQVTGTELKPYVQAGSGATIGATITYKQTQVTARSLKLVLTLHGSLL